MRNFFCVKNLKKLLIILFMDKILSGLHYFWIITKKDNFSWRSFYENNFQFEFNLNALATID